MKTLTWLVAVVIVGLSSSWFVLVMQAFFDDKRIALVGFSGGALAALSMALSETLAHIILSIAAVVNLGFIAMFLWKNYKKPVIYLTSLVFVASLLGGVWLFSTFSGQIA